MRTEEILGRLQKVVKGTHGWKACCPAHKDKTPSLSISEGEEGKTFLKCWAGCQTPAIVAALGLTMADLMGEAKKEYPKAPRKGGRIVKTYDYTDATGRVLFQVCRMEPKNFTQRVPDPDKPGMWKWGRSRFGVSEVIYRLPRVIQAAKAGKIVVVCEGEKDVEACERLGIVATCNPGGAGKWRREFSEAFKGCARVVVIADKDQPGRRHADDVRRMLELDQVTVTVLELPDVGTTAVKDAADWISAGGTLEALKAIIKRAPPLPHFPLPEKEVEVKPTASTVGDGEGKTAAHDKPRVHVEIVVGDTLAKNIANNLYKASRDGDGKARALGTTERREIVSQTVLSWLLERGRFFFHADLKGHIQNMYFDGKINELMMVESDRFQSWIALEAGQNRTNRDFTYFHAAIHDAALCGEKTKGIVPDSYWARCGEAIYVSCGDGMMMRVRAGACELVANGTDDVLFKAGATLAPWKLVKEGEEKDPFDVCRLFRDMACVTPYGKMLVKLWMLGLPAGHTCKPPLVIAGGIGSGKTRTAVGIFELFGMTPRISAIAENGEDNFWTSLDQGGLVCFDNADTRVKWLPDAMAAASTNGSHEKRRMYSDSDLVQQRAHAWAVVTSSNATFAADAGLADRLIVVRLDRRIADTAESALTVEIASNRDACLSWICRTLALALADQAPTTNTINRRHPDWANFAVRCARALASEGEAVEAIKSAESDKSLFSVQNDPIGAMLLQALGAQEVFEGTCTDLIALMQQRCEGFDQHIWSTPKIGKRLDRMWNHLETVFGAKKRILHGKALYVMVGKVGEVEVNPPFLQSDNNLKNTESLETGGQPPPPQPCQSDLLNSDSTLLDASMLDDEGIDDIYEP